MFVRSCWLMPQSPSDCISHPYHIYVYAKCFSNVICYGWAYMDPPLNYHACVGWCEFCENWGLLELKKFVRSWWQMPQSPSDCISHPYHMYVYVMCFSNLICCGWTYMGPPLNYHACVGGDIYCVKMGLT